MDINEFKIGCLYRRRFDTEQVLLFLRKEIVKHLPYHIYWFHDLRKNTPYGIPPLAVCFFKEFE